MISLQPQQNFTIVRQLADSTDAGTYYVQAVVRNAYSDEIIATLNLTDKGSQRFKIDWLVPADPSGQGFYISVLTDVYSDSGYTTKNPLFETEEDTYLVFDRIKANNQGGAGVDYFQIRSLIKDEIAKIKMPEMPDMSAHHQKMEDMVQEVIDLEKRDVETVDISPVLEAISRIPKVDLSPIISKLNEPEKEVDLMPVIERIDATKSSLEGIINKVQASDKNTEISREEMKVLFKGIEVRLIDKMMNLITDQEDAVKNLIRKIYNNTTFETKAKDLTDLAQ